MPPANYLPKVFYRVVVTTPPGKKRQYLGPTSKTYADVKYAVAHKSDAEREGYAAKIYYTYTDWQEYSD